jgi:NADPH-dependent curcumin reductase CurA
MLEVVLNHVNKHARIPVCGMISQYKEVNHVDVINILAWFSIEMTMHHACILKFFVCLMQMWTEREGVRNLLNMVGKEVRMEGFMVLSYFNRFGDFTKEMQTYIKEGKISSKL